MPILIKGPVDIQRMREAGQVVAAVHRRMSELVKPGISTAELDREAARVIAEAGASASFLGYNGFPATICASVNEEVVHGIPGDRRLAEGDIIAIDVGAFLNGFHGDAAATYAVGEVAPALLDLIEAAEQAFAAGFAMATPGNRVGDIAAAIQGSIEAAGYGIVRGYGGHGIGRRMHEDPSVLNYGSAGSGATLQPGMTLAIEPMLTFGDEAVEELADGWTVVTVDRKPSAHYEHTVLITEGLPERLTHSFENVVY